MSPILDFLKKHWKKVAVISGALLLAFGLFMGGRASVPAAKVIYQEKVRTEYVDREVKVEVARELTTEELKKIRDEVRTEQSKTHIREITKPDGTKIRDEVSTTGSTTTKKDVEIRYVDRVVEKKVYVDRVVEKEVVKEVTKTITPPPRKFWEVSAIAAIDVTQVRLAPEVQFPIGFGAQVQVHPEIVVGPVTLPLSFGVLGTHKGVVGFSLGVEF